ncbi:MAG: hypothetical protein PHQ11_07340 [Paludibacter sp.]|nr:hypothetical protein [Paludibacter sp.]
MKKLLLLFVFFPLILGAQEQKKEFLFYHMKKAQVQFSIGTGYIDDGVGLRRAFANEMAVITYLQNLGWHFDDNWGPRYSFSKDVTGWSEEAVSEFLNKIKLTDEVRSVYQIYTKRERRKFDAKAQELGLDPIKWP